MVKITSLNDCGNSPKIEFLKEFNVTFAKGEIEFVLNSVTNDIIWKVIGNKQVNGIDDFLKELNKMKKLKCSELTINQIITHGKEAAVSGVIKMENKEMFAFSDFYTFTSAKGNKIKSITSYIIEI